MDVRVGLWRKLSAKELMLLNCGVREDSFESPLDCKEIQPVHLKGNQSWIFTGRTDAEAETPILWPPDVKNWLTGKDPDAGKGDKGTKEASPTQWTWVWVNSGSWWWTGRPGVLQSMGSQESDSTKLNRKARWLFWHRMAMVFFRLWRKLVKIFFFFEAAKPVLFIASN